MRFILNRLTSILCFTFLLSFIWINTAAAVYLPGQRNLLRIHPMLTPMHMQMKMKKHWMLHLNYMWMNMSGLLDGSQSVNNSEVFSQGFMNAPESMHTQMWMLGVMYMPNMHSSFMLMVPYLDKMMHSKKMNGKSFTTESSGFGDIAAKYSYLLYKSKHKMFHTMLGLTVPTGSITQAGKMGGKMNMRLPYPMQLGSGTVDMLLGSKFMIATKPWYFGATLSGIIRLDKNRFHYALGNEIYGAIWVHRILNKFIIAALRVDARSLGRIRGQDPNIYPKMSPAAAPLLQGGRRVDLSLTFTIHNLDKMLKGQALQIELGHPIYQHLNGPQLKATWFGILNWSVKI